MSLGSEYPEKFDEALHRSLAEKIVSRLVPEQLWRWPSKDENALIEDVAYSLDQLSWTDHADKDNEPGRAIIYQYLLDQADSTDVLERFHEMFR